VKHLQHDKPFSVTIGRGAFPFNDMVELDLELSGPDADVATCPTGHLPYDALYNRDHSQDSHKLIARKKRLYGLINVLREIVDMEGVAVNPQQRRDRRGGASRLASSRWHVKSASGLGYGFSCGRDDLAPRGHRRGAEHAV
jgi:hypothetical protein